MRRPLAALAGTVLTAMLALATSGLLAGSGALVRTCAAIGERGFPRGFELDWLCARDRARLEFLLGAPRLFIGDGDPESVRCGAACLLLATAQQGDQAFVVSAARSGRLSWRMAALHLAMTWAADWEPARPQALAMLAGDRVDRARWRCSHCRWSPASTSSGSPLAGFTRCTERAAGRADVRDVLAAASPAELVARWRERLQADRARTLAELHRDFAARCLTQPRTPHWDATALGIGWQLAVGAAFARWREHVGLATLDWRADTSWLDDPEQRARDAAQVRTAAPWPFPAASLLELFHLAGTAPFLCNLF
ncbi:MAG: hypothetical protein U1E76_28040 [Planctomycetota bacterium]